MIKANRGVIEFKIPASELSIPVCALANKKAGMALPTTPTINISPRFIESYFPMDQMAKGNKKNESDRQRCNKATCSTEKLFQSPFHQYERTSPNHYQGIIKVSSSQERHWIFVFMVWFSDYWLSSYYFFAG